MPPKYHGSLLKDHRDSRVSSKEAMMEATASCGVPTKRSLSGKGIRIPQRTHVYYLQSVHQVLRCFPHDHHC